MEEWDVAIGDEKRAKEALRKKVGSGAIIELAGELTAAQVTEHGLKPGDIKKV